MDIIIRRARASEIDKLVDLWYELINDHLKFEDRLKLSDNCREEYKNYISYHIINPDAFIFVAENKGEVVGYCLSYKIENLPMLKPDFLGYISDISITDKFKGKGVGTLLIDKAKDWFLSENIKIIQLQVYDKNEMGKKFWEKTGFKPFFSRMQLDL